MRALEVLQLILVIDINILKNIYTTEIPVWMFGVVATLNTSRSPIRISADTLAGPTVFLGPFA